MDQPIGLLWYIDEDNHVVVYKAFREGAGYSERHRGALAHFRHLQQRSVTRQ